MRYRFGLSRGLLGTASTAVGARARVLGRRGVGVLLLFLGTLALSDSFAADLGPSLETETPSLETTTATSAPPPESTATTASSHEATATGAPTPESTAASTPEEPPAILPDVLPFAEEVKDPVFALLIGLVDADLYGTLDQQRLQAELDRRQMRSKLPYQRVLEVTRLPAGAGRPTNEVHVRFDGPISLPIPYSILGYNPGSFRTSQECRFREWTLGEVEVLFQKEAGDSVIDVPVVLEDVHLFGLTDGEIDLDIDKWVDALLGASIDDTEMVALMLCRYQGVWHGWAMGYNYEKKGRSGALDFRKDSVVFPSPSEFKAVGRKMRTRAEALLGQANRTEP